MNCCSTGNVLQSTNPRHKVQALCWQVYQNHCRYNKREAFYYGVKIGIHLFAKTHTLWTHRLYRPWAKGSRRSFTLLALSIYLMTILLIMLKSKHFFSALCHRMLPVMFVCDAQPCLSRMLLYKDDRELSRHFHKLRSSDRAAP